MYLLSDAKYKTDAPWEKSFTYRLRKLGYGRKTGRKNVVYIYERPDTSTFRYRVYNVCKSLETSEVWNGTYFYGCSELDDIYPFTNLIDLVVIVRHRWTFELEKAILNFKNRNIKIVFDTDDLIFSIKYLPLLINTLAIQVKSGEEALRWDLDTGYENYCSIVSRIYLTALRAEAFITTNEYLGSKITELFNKPFNIIPNYLNNQQEKLSEKYYLEKSSSESVKPFVIGYFSGSPSHKNDFLSIAAELKKLLDDFPNIILRIVGFIELPLEMSELRNIGRIQTLPLQNFLELQKSIAEADVNIVPLIENEFTNCKSELKFFEASIVGTVTCAAPTFIFKNVIKNGENGYLCSQGEWYDTIKQLYTKGIPKEVCINAYKFRSEKYGSDKQTRLIEDVFNKIYMGK
ncbi:hypothetical protein SDC9_80771 [bioreactor metagenome]|uniref:Glycosyl transferase family 1 domain-containing protein n=1 Tax=bioreactor metagenome TaxID=1076179 RepID=A0A644Z0V8_9ZZZZ